jgi:putative flippase GtrA
MMATEAAVLIAVLVFLVKSVRLPSLSGIKCLAAEVDMILKCGEAEACCSPELWASNLRRSFQSERPGILRRVFRVAAFGFSASVGFVAAEAIIVAGLYVVFGKLEIPGDMSSSPALIVLDAFALAIGVMASFALNERTTVRDAQTKEAGMWATFTRLGRFEEVSALGNLVVIVVQLALLAEFGLTPAIGSIVGAIAGFPVSYLMSMHMVWRVRA